MRPHLYGQGVMEGLSNIDPGGFQTLIDLIMFVITCGGRLVMWAVDIFYEFKADPTLCGGGAITCNCQNQNLPN